MRKSLGIGVVAFVVLALAAVPAVAKDEGHPVLVEMNETLAATGSEVRVAYAEYITSTDGEEVGQIIYANNRSKQLGADWVPNDPNRYGVRNIYWMIDQTDSPTSPSQADANAAIDRAMATWQEVQCSTIPLTKDPDFGMDWGYVEWLVGFGGVPGWYSDLTHAGWLPWLFFEIIGGPGGGDSILGVTYTFIWIDTATGDPTDIDGNGKEDVAFREIYYNDDFSWAIDANYDIETVVLHETGHGLSQGHFGKIFRTKNGKLHFAPLAVMNAAYSGVQQELTGTDVGGHCSIWGSWPNN